MLGKLKCSNCGSGNLVFYKEKTYIYETSLTIKNKIPKKEKLLYIDDKSKHIDCKNCGRVYSYNMDENGSVIILDEL